jgi:hypothetical protein
MASPVAEYRPFMFEDYNTNQLLALRSLCADIIERTDDLRQRADTLLVFECLEEELAMREQKQSA